jgi:hypothetical protein
MRRAISEIVPIQVVERRRKAFIVRGPMRAFRSGRSLIEGLFRSSIQETLGLINSERLLNVLDQISQGDELQWHPGLQRAIDIELWLMSLKSRGQPVALSWHFRPMYRAAKLRSRRVDASSDGIGNWTKTKENNVMKYNKPTVLKTVNASRNIMGTVAGKGMGIQQDNFNPTEYNATPAAYEADE